MPRTHRTILTAEQVEAACKRMKAGYYEVNLESVGRALGVRGKTLSNYPELRAIVDRYRSHKPERRVSDAELCQRLRATEPPLKTWIDPSIKGTWKPTA